MTQMWNEILEQPVALERCLEKNIPAMNEIIKALHSQDIRHVLIAARGTSDHAAVYGKYVIELMTGIPVTLAATSIFTIYKRNMDLRNCLVIGISPSGNSADVAEVIRNGNSSGAITVAITNSSDSLLVNESKYFLSCEAGAEKSITATKTFTAQIFLLASLAVQWSKNHQISRDLYSLPEKVSHAFEVTRSIEDRIERYHLMDECFVLARGVNYSVSLEAALMIQEAAYVRAKAYATSDFQHGPIAMVEPEIPVMIFAPDGPSLQDVSSLINKLRQDEVETIIISNRKDILDLGTVSFVIPETSNDVISPFYNVVAAQIFACKLAEIKGINPDIPSLIA